jgi:hypothetical protein
MLVRSLHLLSAASAALAAVIGAWLALDSVQFLIEQFRLAATVGILAASCGLLVASVLLVVRPSAGKVLAAVCAIAAVFFVIGGLSHMGNLPFVQAVAQAACPRGAALCFPQAATFIYALAVLSSALYSAARVERCLVAGIKAWRLTPQSRGPACGRPLTSNVMRLQVTPGVIGVFSRSPATCCPRSSVPIPMQAFLAAILQAVSVCLLATASGSGGALSCGERCFPGYRGIVLLG